MDRYLDYCGAFQGRALMRKGETPEQARERIERLILSATDRVKSLSYGVNTVNFGVDEDVKVVNAEGEEIE
jgi:hypothetical protein